jgi:hypothetical protein
MDGSHFIDIKRNAFVTTELAEELELLSDIQQDQLAKILKLLDYSGLDCECGCRGRRHIPHMKEVVNWWDEYGLKNWETDDFKPILKQLFLKLATVPEREQAVYLFGSIYDWY